MLISWEFVYFSFCPKVLKNWMNVPMPLAPPPRSPQRRPFRCVQERCYRRCRHLLSSSVIITLSSSSSLSFGLYANYFKREKNRKWKLRPSFFSNYFPFATIYIFSGHWKRFISLFFRFDIIYSWHYLWFKVLQFIYTIIQLSFLIN